ncbi:MAG: aldehyde ferredoxin oxidoreductase family protein [Desulfatitalea sp.]|nr:aldehyde ferredoxin oxidoreductase family protein [Desulfatitalea sp.]NNK00387.1 aldehyde ferredoxin oxidoreductase family protein [Desulfatitalea sp.]
MKGYCGKILIVNLSTGEIGSEAIGDDIYEMLLSGVGLGAYYLYRHIPAMADPLGPDNILGFTSGLLTGSGSLVTGRWMVVCKSPLTGGWGDANCGGTFSPAIKRCGYDALFFKGISAQPVYLYMDNHGASLRDAAHLWGIDTVESESLLRNECKAQKKPSVAVIGPAGENGALISGISNDSGRMAARSGVGAVMGSKKLKAVVLAGSRRIAVHDSARVKAISKAYAIKIKKAALPKIMKGWMLPLMGKMMAGSKNNALMDGLAVAAMNKKWGTIANNTVGVPNGDSPIKNWGGSVKDYGWGKYRHLNPDRILRRHTKPYACYACPIGCGGISAIQDVRDGRFKHTHKPEYETCAAFGGLILNSDLDAIFYINELLNRAGMDTISAGGVVAFAMECFQNGIITKADTAGLELSWGNADAVIELLRRMIQRRGIGDLLADGVKKAAEKIGAIAQPYAVHAGGQEPGMHDGKMDPLTGLHFSVEPTPGRHTIGAVVNYNLSRIWEFVSWAPKVPAKYPKDKDYAVNEENARKAKANSCLKMILDGAGGCLFAVLTGLNHWKIFDWLNATTGWDKTPDDYMQIGMRIQTLRQMFNIKHGIDPKTFKMHDRMSGKTPLKEGPLAGIALAIEPSMQSYWKELGWDENSGIPTQQALDHLQLTPLLNGEVF